MTAVPHAYSLSPTLPRAGTHCARRWIGILACLAALPAACSDSETADPAPAAPSSSVLSPSTTTTIGTTTTTEDPDIAAVRQAHLAFLEMFEVVGDPPNPDHPEIALRTTGDAYERLRSNLEEARLTGNRLTGGWDSRIQSIEVEGSQATVVDCSLDLGRLTGPQGELVMGPDAERALRTTRLEKGSSGWKVWRLDVQDPPLQCAA